MVHRESLLFGFILAGMLENRFTGSKRLYDWISFIWERYTTPGLPTIAAIVIDLPIYHARRAFIPAAGR